SVQKLTCERIQCDSKSMVLADQSLRVQLFKGGRTMWTMKTCIGVSFALLLTVSVCFSPAAAQTFTWQEDPTAMVTGFNVERAPETGNPITCGTFAQIASIGNVLTYTDTDASLKPGAAYCYRVRAFNTYGVSDYSNVATWVKPRPAATLNVVVTMSITGAGAG